MRCGLFRQTLSFLTGLCLVALPLPVLAQDGGNVDGRWVPDRERNCQVYSLAVATSVFIEGNCDAGLVQGPAKVSIFMGRELRDFYTGYFLRGLYVAQQPVEGQILDTAHGTLFAFPRTRDGITLYTPVTARARESVICSNRLVVTVEPGRQASPAQFAALVSGALRSYGAVCGGIPAANLTLQVMPPTFLLNAAQTEPLQTLQAIWDGSIWRVNAPTPPANTGQRLDWRAAVTAERRDLTPIAPQGVAMGIAAYLTQGAPTGFPECRVNVEVANEGRLPITRLTLAGTSLGDGQTRISDFMVERTTPLPAGGRVTLRRQIPARACGFIRTLSVERVQCSAASGPLTDCRNAVTFRPGTATVNDDMQRLPGVRVAF